MRSVQIVLRGHVQGVFLRATVARYAQTHGILGWVRNEPDGTVSIRAQSSTKSIDDLLAWLRTQPTAGRIEQVAATEVELSQVFVGFSIL